MVKPCLFLLTPTVVLAAAGAVRAEVDYLREVKPLLEARCYACHGALKQEGGLRLDTAALIRQGGESGPAVAAGDVGGSLLVERVATSDIDDRMPPEHEGEAFKPAEIDFLRGWIAAGATGPAHEQPEADPRDHWAFRPVVRPPVPPMDPSWGRNPIDAFIAAQHRANGLKPQSEAPPEVLIRRLYFDLVGLPPGADEVRAAADSSDGGWYQAAVDRLLDDPRHGERWARHWMDVWRYSDWWGLGDQLRNSQKHIWHWRDWIIESLNTDLSYAEMVRLMLAADELHPGDLARLRATGYLARNYFIFNRNQWMEETVEHVSKGLLGLTMNCAKCHDHKYDPVDQKDYFRMRAFFEPYHVRLDMVPGESDFERGGVPRVYDGWLEEPTWRFVRGEEARPDKSAAIPPGVPGLLAFRKVEVQPVSLPEVAWQPERQPWVIDAHVAEARRAVESAEATRPAATNELAQAEARLTEVLADGEARPSSGPPAPTLSEPFDVLDPRRWKMFGGDWVHAPGQIEQKRDGPERSVLRLLEPAPRDVDVTLRFTTLGGSQWRSVGISLDAPGGDPGVAPVAGDTEVSLYASAFAGGPKVQAAVRRGAEWEYPTDAASARPVEVGREHTLRVQARDTLINVFFDGALVIAWRSPVPRRDGAVQITTFDALAVFHEVSVAPLPADAPLKEPAAGGGPATTPEGARQAVELAQAKLRMTDHTVDLARARLRSVESRGKALQASWDSAPDADAKRADAVRAQRDEAVAAARHGLAEKEVQALQAAPDKKAESEQAVVAAREALTKAEEAAAQPVAPDATVAGLAGARWTPTRFRNSTVDDPDVPFPPQSTGRRTAFADWVTDTRNPLTARVAVNHIWARHMGTPLVATMFDFGRKAAAPTHPELLDWLAAEFMEHGWSMKHLHRLIVGSSAYRLSSSVAGGEEALAKVPDNRHLWRRGPGRLEAELVRDAILAHSGELDSAIGGPPVPPDAQSDSKRRSLYFYHSNNDRNLLLTTFDGAAVKECYRREQSIVPQQALALSNSRLVQDAARKIADRLSAASSGASASASADDDAFIRQAWLELLAVRVGEAELASCRRALDRWRALDPADPGAARAHLVWTLLNHNDFVTLR
jgi:hypothetical protein